LNGAADDTEQVGLVGGEDAVGGDELVAGGLQGGGEAGSVGVGVGGRDSTALTMAIRRSW